MSKLSPRQTEILDAIHACGIIRFTQLAVQLNERFPADELRLVLISLERRGFIRIELNSTNPAVWDTAAADVAFNERCLR